jgi:hypothetical protein
MPAIDQCEPQIIRALQKQGWIITHQPYPIRIEKSRTRSHVYADLRLENLQSQQSAIIIEIKCFPENRSLMDEIQQAVGQYIIYRNALKLNKVVMPVYLAVPQTIYESFFRKPLMQGVIEDTQLKIVVIDLDNEEVISWTP